jgi:thiaminase/transcriptional activator TenA
MYAGEGYETVVRSYRTLVENAARTADEKTLQAMGVHFTKACELEWMFWTAADEGLEWPSFD